MADIDEPSLPPPPDTSEDWNFTPEDWNHELTKLAAGDKPSVKDALLSAAGAVLGVVGAIIGFLVIVVVGGTIIYGFTLVLGLIWEGPRRAAPCGRRRPKPAPEPRRARGRSPRTSPARRSARSTQRAGGRSDLPDENNDGNLYASSNFPGLRSTPSTTSPTTLKAAAARTLSTSVS